MQRRRVGSLEISAIGLGSGPLCIEGRPSEADAIRVIHAALDSGTTWIDTADSYCLGERDLGYGEQLVKKALDQWSGARSEVLVATKGGHTRPNGTWGTNGHPRYLREACERSLRALGVSSHGLYYFHRPDPAVYFPDSIGALADLRREGKIQNVGLSNVDVGHVRAAAKIVPIASVQNGFSPFGRQPLANGIIELCERQGIAFVAYSPVGGTGGESRLRAVPALVNVAARHDATLYQVALAWVLSTSRVMLAIPGSRRPETATSNSRGGSLVLTPQDLAELERAFPPAGLVKRELMRAKRVARQILREVRKSS